MMPGPRVGQSQCKARELHLEGHNNWWNDEGDYSHNWDTCEACPGNSDLIIKYCRCDADNCVDKGSIVTIDERWEALDW